MVIFILPAKLSNCSHRAFVKGMACANSEYEIMINALAQLTKTFFSNATQRFGGMGG